MKLSEFIIAAQEHQKRRDRFVLIVLASFMTALCALAWAARWYGAFLRAKFGAGAVTGLLGPLPLLVVAVGLIFWMRKWVQQLNRAYGLVCPACGKDLAMAHHVVIASKCCPHCGQRVIEEDAARA